LTGGRLQPVLLDFSDPTEPGLWRRGSAMGASCMAKQALNRITVNFIIALQKHGFLVFHGLKFGIARR
jgi:hypothetical protein